MKKRLLFLTLYNESGASSRVAIYQFLPFFREAGYHVDVKPLLEGDAYEFLGKLAGTRSPLVLAKVILSVAAAMPKRLGHVLQARSYDAVIVQKDVLPLGLGWLLARGQKNIIYEFDDPIWLAHPASGGNVKLLGPLLAQYRKRCLVRMLRASKLVVVDSPPLRDFALSRCANSIVLNTSIDLDPYHVVPEKTDRPGLAWIGSPSTTYLIQAMIPWLEKLAVKFPIRLYNLGSHPIRSDRFPIENLPWSTANEVKYLARVAVGLMPADDLPFNRYRFSRKWLHYGAARLPTLATDIGLNPIVVRPDENGLLYRHGDLDDFLRQAGRLLSDEPLRRRMGDTARALIEREYDLPVVGRTFVSLVDAALDAGDARKESVPVRAGARSR